MPDKQTFPPPRKKQPMQQTLRYTDPKSDKFWRIETLANQFVVNYGKYGTNGRYEIKEFDSPEECEKQAAKLAAAKQKKGYAPAELPAGHLYFDDEEYGRNPLTSHPTFRQYFTKKPSITAKATKKPPSAATTAQTPCAACKKPSAKPAPCCKTLSAM